VQHKKVAHQDIPKSKFIFVTGGVISGLGKGITCASLARLVQEHGYKVSVAKADMYLNLDAGTMNPLEHGEVFVTEDGMETDQDVGHYERFINQDLSRNSYFTLGQIYYDVISKERRLEYDGKCVEGHIHIPEEIIGRILNSVKDTDTEVTFIEVGGTVGEYQNIMFYEAIRRFKQRYPNNVFLVHLVYLIVPGFLGEMKSKPAQSSIYELYKLGLQPNFVVCRGDTEVDEKRKTTISFNTGVKYDHIISAPDVDTIYEIPLVLKRQKMDVLILEEMGLKPKSKTDTSWEIMVKNTKKAKDVLSIAIAGKYFTSGNFCLEDSYVCVIEAIKHACWKSKIKPEIHWFDVEKLENPKTKAEIEKQLIVADGIIVPQGWGKRGVEGKLEAVRIARENKIPYLGLCFGMQMAVIEYARNVLKLRDANSEEVDPNTKNKVIHIMELQKEFLTKQEYGGTIRLGAYPCKIKPGTLLEDAYKKNGAHRINKGTVMERHRHRYEFNNQYRQMLEDKGLVISGTSPDNMLVESIELPVNTHPFFVGTQFHPEYKSRPLDPHPIFCEFINVSKKIKIKNETTI
jgi:CTP synthase